jgi:hypothetical protein
LNTGAAAVLEDVKLLVPKGSADLTAADAAAVVDDELSPLMLVAICGGIADGFA